MIDRMQEGREGGGGGMRDLKSENSLTEKNDEDLASRFSGSAHGDTSLREYWRGRTNSVISVSRHWRKHVG